MPIYEYRCKECSAKFEKILFRSSEEITCPECGNTQVDRLFSTFAVQSDHSAPVREAGPCPCGAAERGMCQAMADK